MREVVIVSAVRTPIGKFKGAFNNTSAVSLGTSAVKELLSRSQVDPTSIDQVILGNVLQAGIGQNPARQVAIHSEIPTTTPAMTINEVCGSGLKSVILGKQAIQLGDADTVIVGGIENMSLSPLLHQRPQADQHFDESLLVDSMISDGLTDAFSHQHMGTTAEAVAEKYQITRQEQDTYANNSQLKAAASRDAGYFKKEIVPVTLADGTVISEDQGIRTTSSEEKLATLKPAFQKDGTVTAGNASTINDGASVLLLMAKDIAEAKNIPYMATVDAYSEIGNDPNYMGYAPYYAIKQLITKMDCKISDIDLFEINEAFASQSLAIVKDLELPTEKVNINGGAIALGHPLGASGARILTTLLYTMERENKTNGIASLCVGGGIGLALAVSRPTN